MKNLQKHIPTLLLYLVMLGNLSFVNDPPLEKLPSNELPPLSLPSNPTPAIAAPSDTVTLPNTSCLAFLQTTDADKLGIAKATKPNPSFLSKILPAKAKDRHLLYVLILSAELVLIISLLLFLVLHNIRKQKRNPQLCSDVYIPLSTNDQAHHILYLAQHPLPSNAIPQLETHSLEQQGEHAQQFCGYDIQYLLSLSEDSAAWDTITHEVVESSPIITQRGINSIGDCMFDTFYDTDTIALHCELLQPPKARNPRNASKPRDPTQILEQLEKERERGAKQVFQQRMLDLGNEKEEEPNADNTAEQFTNSLLNRIEDCKLAYRMMKCFSEKANTAVTNAEASIPNSNPTSSDTPPAATDPITTPEAATASPAEGTPPASSITTEEEAARKIALKLERIFHSNEAAFVKGFKAGIQAIATETAAVQATHTKGVKVKGVKASRQKPDTAATTVAARATHVQEKAGAKTLQTALQAGENVTKTVATQALNAIAPTQVTPQVATPFAEAITQSIAHVHQAQNTSQPLPTVVNDLLKDQLAIAAKRMLIQACLQVMAHIQQANHFRGYGQKQRLDSS
jgi:hypothetical protein